MSNGRNPFPTDFYKMLALVRVALDMLYGRETAHYDMKTTGTVNIYCRLKHRIWYERRHRGYA